MKTLPSKDDIDQASQVIKFYSNVGFLPEKLFLAIAKSSVTATAELVAFVEKPEGLHVVVTQRPDDDPNWPGYWHVPGKVIRPTDSEGSLSDALSRAAEDELGGAAIKSGPHEYKTVFNQVKRGAELTVYHWAVLKKEPATGKTVPIDKLPEPFVKHQYKLVSSAVTQYEKDK